MIRRRRLNDLTGIGEAIRQRMEARNAARDRALADSRIVVRYAANSIRAAHRQEFEEAKRLLELGKEKVEETKANLADHPSIYWTGYVQDAQKEHAEAQLVYALVHGAEIPGPEELGVEDAPYLNGAGEAVGEMRRHVLDVIRRGHTERAEEVLESMEEIYNLLVTIDYPEALTGGLKRTTDMVRGVVERTRGDLTLAIRQQELQTLLECATNQSRKRAEEPAS
jgi:translin